MCFFGGKCEKNNIFDHHPEAQRWSEIPALGRFGMAGQSVIRNYYGLSHLSSLGCSWLCLDKILLSRTY